MGEIYLIRHGQASFGAANYDQLSATGEEQSRRLGAWLAASGIAFDAVLAGERVRQRETARLMLEGAGLAAEVRVLGAFNELDADRLLSHAVPRLLLREPLLAGRFALAGANKTLFREIFERVVDEWVRGDWEDAGIGRWIDFRARVVEALGELARDEGTGRRIAVCTSGGPITATLQALGHDRGGRLDWNIANTSMTRLAYDAEGRLTRIDSHLIPHLDAELVTYL
jgi:broad specificity phosphatase PhoE